jgi:hypothetical protein
LGATQNSDSESHRYHHQPEVLNFYDWDITFTVPRQVSDRMGLTDASEYGYLVTKALQIKANPSAKIIVEPKEVCSLCRMVF